MEYISPALKAWLTNAYSISSRLEDQDPSETDAHEVPYDELVAGVGKSIFSLDSSAKYTDIIGRAVN